MKDDANLADIMQDWVKKASPNPLNYHDGALNGNDCMKMMKNFHFLENHKKAEKWYSIFAKN